MIQIHQNIWAVGRNYANHAKEMKADLPQEPLIFLKAGSCLSYENEITLPAWSDDVHHEIELALLIDENLNFSHITLALDLTDRQAQSLAKKNGTPWTLSKSFKQACPISKWIPFVENTNYFFNLVKNHNEVQSGCLNEMIFKPDILLNYIKNHFPVVPGDIILTGTPEGVGPIKSKDVLEAKLWLDSSKNHALISEKWLVK